MSNWLSDAYVWRWPVPVYQGGTEPVISDGFSRTSRGGKGHLGVDIVYRRAVSGQERLPDQTKSFFMPSNEVYAIACFDGYVWSVDEHDIHGGAVKVDHGAPMLSAYRHLSSVIVKKGDRISKGQKLGIIGNDPMTKDINHLHFELWDTSRPKDKGQDMRDAFAINPEGAMSLLWDFQWEDGSPYVKPRDKSDLVAMAEKYEVKSVGGAVLAAGGIALAIALKT